MLNNPLHGYGYQLLGVVNRQRGRDGDPKIAEGSSSSVRQREERNSRSYDNYLGEEELEIKDRAL